MSEHNDLYHPNRTPLGQTIARDAPQPPHTYRIGACICLFNPHDEMLIQQRHSGKTDWPGRWDISVSGLAQPGETSQQTATRELHEELGIHHDFSQTAPVLTLTHDDDMSCFDDYYLLHAAPNLAELTLQTEEVAAVRWANLAAIHSLLAAGQFIPYHPALLEYLFHRARTGSVYHSP
ncbi:MAG: NUDIX domain-containing protein [Cardiobacteriaceae bacterium]|nr:NUDIX domain-containing protein [Cardiobacteriaceae bacterium]